MSNFDLDTPLIDLVTSAGRDCITIRQACTGIQIFGSTGSGKTSGSGNLIANKYLLNGFGGLILTVKPDEVDLWRSYCWQTNRSDDLIVIEPGGQHRFNFMDVESGYGQDELAATDNIMDMLTTVIQAGSSQESGQSDDPFWRNSLELLISNSIDLCKLAYGRVTIQNLYAIVNTIPKEGQEAPSPDEPTKAFNLAFDAARANVMAQIDKWTATLDATSQERFADDGVYEMALLDALPDARLLKFVDGFFVDTFIPLSQKTRSVIDASCVAFLYRLLREPFYSLFCRYASTVTPEDCFKGKVVLINLPILTYRKAGRDAQLMVKYCFQRAWQRRDVHKNPRPVFLWVDESQHLLLDKDAEFLTTARSSRIATVFLTQNLPNYLGMMSGDRAEHRVRSLLGNFGTKILHASSDSETNEWYSRLIGDAFFEDVSESTTVAQNFSQTRGRSLKLERLVRPEEFSRLLTGGPKNGLRVEAYIHRQGDVFPNGYNHMKLTFKQEDQPT
ncbi:type IV secretory system conjugative DNA transfer family protein [uncultured Fibrella sp.]|uniref:type IV secretory system conjugative DNA transfer family protein n=1 Tax=uncultured Fibrella sp. TaxID=1284596 RepID=UPI0035CA3D66